MALGVIGMPIHFSEYRTVASSIFGLLHILFSTSKTLRGNSASGRKAVMSLVAIFTVRL
jgi:hypothetical protein